MYRKSKNKNFDFQKNENSKNNRKIKTSRKCGKIERNFFLEENN